jgi:hypothetical protein
MDDVDGSRGAPVQPLQGVSLLTRDQPEAALVVAPDGCVLHWFCAYPGGPTEERSLPPLPTCPSSHEHLDVGW